MADRGPAPEGGGGGGRTRPLADALGVLIAEYRRLAEDGPGCLTAREAHERLVLPMLGALGWRPEDAGPAEGDRGAAGGPLYCELAAGATAAAPRISVATAAIPCSLDASCAARGASMPYPEQAVRHAWNARADWALLTNFGELRLYNALAWTPGNGLALSVSIDDMPRRLDDLSVLARDSVASGRLRAAGLRRGRMPVDRQIVEDLGAMRREMCGGLIRKGARIGEGEGEGGKGEGGKGGLASAAQTLIDRLVIARAAEDRGLLEAGALRNVVERWRAAGQGASLAGMLRARLAVIPGLRCAAPLRPCPADGLEPPGGMLARAVERLYAYDFALIDSDALGGAYEDYLASSPAGRGGGGGGAGGGAGAGAGAGARRSLGAYYTPAHLVSHMLDETLGRRLAECRTPGDVSGIRVLDPSCGSGSFLAGAFDMLLGWYRAYNRGAARNPVADPGLRILRDNLFGIDIDPRAAGNAAACLALRAAAADGGRGPAPGPRILAGNALVTGREPGYGRLGPAERAALRPLDPSRLPQERFDVVVGNPPYYAVRAGDPIRVSGDFKAVRGGGGGAVNAAMMFVRRSIGLLGGRGRLGLVLPKMCSYAKGWSAVRALLLDRLDLAEVVDCMEAFRGVSLEQIIVLGEKRAGSAECGGRACRVGRAGPRGIRPGGAVPASRMRADDMIHTEPDPGSWEIAEKMRRAGVPLGDLLRGGGSTIATGEYLQGLDCWLGSRPPGGLRMLAGGDIARYRICASRYYRRGDLPAAEGREGGSRRAGAGAGASPAPRVVGQRIVAHICSPVPHIELAFAYDGEGSRGFDTVTHVLPGGKIRPHALAAVLNSRAASWYAHRFVFCNAVRSMDLRPHYMERIVVPRLDARAEDALDALGRRMHALARSEDADRPRIRDRLVAGRARGAQRLGDYIGAAGYGDVRVHDRAARGSAWRVVAADEGGGWIGFFADYSPPRTRILRRKKIVSLRVRGRGMRDYIRAEAGGALRPARGGEGGDAPLYGQVLGARIGAYGGTVSESAERLEAMLGPYSRAAERHDAWRARFAAADAEIDRIVFGAFGLSEAESRRILASSRPPGLSGR